MRRQPKSVVILLSAILGLSLIYLGVPNEPLSGAFKNFVFGVDNRLRWSEMSGTQDQAQANRLAELEAENQRLRRELRFIDDSRDFISGTVVSKNAQNYRATIDIDIGSDGGLKAGLPVLAQGQLVGRVHEVLAANRSRVLLLPDPDFRAAAVIENTNIEGLVRPTAGGLILEQVSSGVNESLAGNRVVTSGLGGVFRPGLLLGTVGDDISPENAIFREYVLESTLNLGSLQSVMVLR